MQRLLTGMSEAVASETGERVEVDGRVVTRSHATLTGIDAFDLFGPGDEESPGSLGSDPDDRQRRIEAFVIAHTTARVTADIDDDGRLRRVEVVMSQDRGEYEECEALFDFLDGFRVVLDHLGEPQHIEAPPADLVDENDDLMSTLPGEGVDPDSGDLSEPEYPSEGEAPDEPTYDTVAGPRTFDRILTDLRVWAEERAIDWTKVPIPDPDDSVALFNQWFDEELATRGPALDTSDGRWSRGDVIDALRNWGDLSDGDPDGDVEFDVDALSDDQLAEKFELLMDQLPPDVLSSRSPGDLGPADFEGDDEAWEADLYEGCPA